MNLVGKQEPHSNEEVLKFAQQNYGVTFQMMEKIHVNGDDKLPLFGFLKTKTSSKITWNFHKVCFNSLLSL